MSPFVLLVLLISVVNVFGKEINSYQDWKDNCKENSVEFRDTCYGWKEEENTTWALTKGKEGCDLEYDERMTKCVVPWREEALKNN